MTASPLPFLKSVVVALVLLWAFPSPAAQTGTLDYPSEDNLDFKEGTVEFWFQPGYDTASHLPSTETFDGLAAILDLRGDTGAMGVSHFAGGAAKPSAILSVRLSSDRQDLFGVSGGEFTPKKGEWHHFALSWKDKVVNFYLDGAIAPGRKGKMSPFTALDFLHLAFGTVGRHPIRVGDKWNARSRFAVDDFRLSAVARAPEELGFRVGPLKPDPSTRILDGFESPFDPDGKQRTRPAVIFSGEGGLPSPQCRFVEGKFGKALALYREE
jgi:hypothetical protein